MKSSTALDLCSDVNFSNEQEFYVRLLTNNIAFPGLSEFNPEFLKNYEIAKLVLEKFSFNLLSEKQQKNLNLESFSVWFNSSEYIHLKYDIPEILELLPERIVGGLNLEDSQIQSLPKLESVGEDLDLKNSQIHSLPKLESVGDYLNLTNSQIQSLPQLNSVGGGLNLRNSQIQSLPKLESVGMSLFLQDSKIQSLPKLESVGMSLFLQDSKIQSLPKLESVGRGLYLLNSKIQSLPKLKTVGEGIFVPSDKKDYWTNYFRETGRANLTEKVKTK